MCFQYTRALATRLPLPVRWFYSCYPEVRVIQDIMRLQGAVQTKRIDPLLCDLELAHSGMFYPAGFPLHIATNSRHVLEAAAESWGAFHREFDTPAMKFRVVVEPGGERGAEPAFRMQGHLLSFVSDARNFAAGDRLTMSASFHLSAATAADHSFMRWFYLESMAYMLLTQRYVVSVHAACVEYGGAGILICGKSGAGKSTWPSPAPGPDSPMCPTIARGCWPEIQS